MPTPEEVAAHLDLTDIFALRRVSDEQLVNLAGAGRGAGWAGNISVNSEREPLIAEAMASGDVVHHVGQSGRIFGPYWTESAAVLSMGDFIFVLGGPGVSTHDDETLFAAMGELAWSIGDVPAEKRLADELEVTKVALSVASLTGESVEVFLENLSNTAIEALGCEFGAVVLSHPTPQLIIAPNGWQPDATSTSVLDALMPLLDSIDGVEPYVTQDLSEDPRANSPLGFGNGLISRCVIPLDVKDGKGAIVVAHTEASPRGFTNLCQVVATTIGSQASLKLESGGLLRQLSYSVDQA